MLMAGCSISPPGSLGGMPVKQVRNYLGGEIIVPGGENQKLEGPVGDLVILDLASTGNYVAVRPSGTEPKVKFYLFGYVPAEQLHDLEATKEEVATQLAQVREDLAAYVKQTV